MSFQIIALDPAPFAPLFDLSDDDLAARGIVRQIVAASPGTPCRVSLADAGVGETVLLLNYEHLPVATPFRSAHAIFVRQGVDRSRPPVDEIPEMIARRLISARAFDGNDMMIAADVAEGNELAPLIDRLFADTAVTFIHLHIARQGCFAGRVDRA